MLGSILAVLLVFAGICCGIASFFAGKKHNARGKKSYLIAFCCVVVLFLVVPFSIHTVEPGQVAVVKVWGKATNIRSSGTYFDFWLSKQYNYYDTTVQQNDIKTMCYSLDAQTMDVELVVQYQIQSDKAVDIANNYGNLDNLDKRITAVAMDQTKTVLSQKSAMKIIETRSQVSPAIEQAIKEAVVGDYYVDITAVVITNIDFSDAFEATVEDKMIAEQQQLKAEYEKQKAIIEAEKELEVARLEAQARLAIAQADADAIKAKSIEVARMLGFAITQTQVDDTIRYDIDFSGQSDEKIKLISDYLKYTEYLAVWDGVLPQVVSDGASVYIPLGE